MAGSGGCNMPSGNLHGNAFPGGMRGGAGSQFPSTGQPVGAGNNACQPGVPGAPNTTVGGGDMCCGNGQSQGPNAQHISSGMNSQMGGYQGCTSNGMPGIRPGMQGNNFMPNGGGFHNDFVGSHGQVKRNIKNYF